MSEKEYPRILTAGDGCMVAEFGDTIDLGINSRVAELRDEVKGLHISGVIDLVPTYRSLAVYFDPLKADVKKLRERLEILCQGGGNHSAVGHRTTVVVPTLYGGEWGPDLEDVAKHTGFSPEEVIKRHSGQECYCYMLGFTPGFPYLGGMDPALEVPRLKNPREVIPGGSVAIGGKQTGIYSLASPGGWRLIGRTPMLLFDPDRDPPIFLQAGMWIRFKPIEKAEFDEIEEASRAGAYRPEIFTEEEAAS